MVRRDSHQGADLRAQEERSPLVREHRERRKKEHGLHLLERLIYIHYLNSYLYKTF